MNELETIAATTPRNMPNVSNVQTREAAREITTALTRGGDVLRDFHDGTVGGGSMVGRVRRLGVDGF